MISENILNSLSGLLIIIVVVVIIIRDERLNIILKLFFIKTPIIRIIKIDKDKNISGNIMYKLFIIINLYSELFDIHLSNC